MKTSLFTLAAVVSMLYACNTPQSISSAKYSDDIYTSSSELAADKEKRQKDAELAREQREEEARQREEAEKQRMAQSNNNNNQSTETADDYYQSKRSTTETTTDRDGSVTNVTNNYYDRDFSYDDYYDNEYSVRLRRFHNNIGAYGYYDDYYTNSYWYTGNPYNYGSSIYLGYNFWGPTYTTFSYSPGYNWYSNMGWGYDPWYSPNNYYNPYYGAGYYGGGYYGAGYYGYNPYMGAYGGYGGYGGYNQAYWNGYNNGFNDGYFANNYFNSYDNNSYYYGPRGTTGSNSRATIQPTMANRYIAAIEQETQKPFDATKGRDNNPYINKTASKAGGTPTRTDNTAKPAEPVNPDYKPATNNNNNSAPARTNKLDQNNNFNVKPAEKQPVYDVQPTNTPSKYDAPQQQTQPKYEQPKYEQPKQHNEQPKYEQPKQRNEQPKNEQPKQEQPQPRFEQPRNNAQPQQAPASTPAPRSNSGAEPKPRR